MSKQTTKFTFGYDFAKLANLSKPEETQKSISSNITSPKIKLNRIENNVKKPKTIKYSDLEKVLDPTHTKYKNNVNQNQISGASTSKTEFKEFQEKANTSLDTVKLNNHLESSNYLEKVGLKNYDSSDTLFNSLYINPKNSISGSLVTLEKFNTNNQNTFSDFSTHNYLINFMLNNSNIVNINNNTELKQASIINLNLNNVQLNQPTKLNNQNNFILKSVENRSFSIVSNINTRVSQSVNLANSLNTAINSTANVFGKNIDNVFNTKQLINSQYISFDNPLEKLNARINTTNNNESWQNFFEKLFSKDTAKELGKSLLSDVESLGKDLLKSLAPTFTFNSKKYFSDKILNDFYSKVNKDIVENNSFNTKFSTSNSTINSILGEVEYVNAQVYATNTSDDKILVDSTITPYVIGDIGGLADQLELALLKKLNINTEHDLPEVGIPIGDDNRKVGISEKRRQDRSELFKSFVSKNPLLGQYQFDLVINNLGNKKVTDVLNVKDIEENLYTFRVQGIKIPDLERSVINEKYGNSILSNIANLQANVENKAELEIICDRNLDTLEYLTRLTGLGVCKSSEKSTERVYNLSTISESNFNEENTDALLSVINGRSLNKSLNFENPEWEFNKSGPDASTINVNYSLDETLKSLKSSTSTSSNISKDKIIYAMLPSFYFENFKIINLDYSFKLENSNSAKLLNIKATCTWSNLYLDYNDPNTVDYYDLPVTL